MPPFQINCATFQRRLPFLVDQQVREVHLFEFQLDRFDKFGGDELCRLPAKLHRFFQRFHAEFHHHRIGITINYDSIVFVTIFDTVPEKKKSQD